jgi:hypothetical protein
VLARQRSRSRYQADHDRAICEHLALARAGAEGLEQRLQRRGDLRVLPELEREYERVAVGPQQPRELRVRELLRQLSQQRGQVQLGRLARRLQQADLLLGRRLAHRCWLVSWLVGNIPIPDASPALLHVRVRAPSFRRHTCGVRLAEALAGDSGRRGARFARASLLRAGGGARGRAWVCRACRSARGPPPLLCERDSFGYVGYVGYK